MIIANFLPMDNAPWLWIKVVLLGAAVILMGTMVTRFSLWQRDEYWRERGKDPKHPERIVSPAGESN
ncbi:hypothetical protein [Arthrobacter sp. NPDC056493]|uniref:hypothetical protein n=1 Tax=Arthrobacter sp. NPDC056493 TaxID=3345839 RepID=UPI00366D0C44